MPLTDSEIRSTVPRERPFKISDGGGLHILVNPNGSRLWRLKYRFQGKERLASFGSYPAISIKLARQRRDDFRRILATGDDPMAPRRGRTFEAVSLEWLDKHARHFKPAYRLATCAALNRTFCLISARSPSPPSKRPTSSRPPQDRKARCLRDGCEDARPCQPDIQVRHRLRLRQARSGRRFTRGTDAAQDDPPSGASG